MSAPADRPAAAAVSENDVAVVGMALRVPGADTPEAFWRNLRAGVESIERFSVEELEAAGVDPALLRDPAYVRAAGVLDGIDRFDAGFFGIGAKDAGIMDPQHRLFLECAWEALEDSGHTAASFRGAIGVFAGCGMGSYFIYNILSNPDLVRSAGIFLLRHTSNDKDFLSTFVSYKLGLTGPSVNVQTACSTSLVAIHAACQSLLNGECDMALAGGSTISVPHRVGYLYREGEVLSPDGHCRAFDARAAGTVFGNGAGVVVLRRLADALADGDPIHAVVKGSAINNDGSQKAGYLAPSVDGQAQAIAEAISVAGVAADDISYVEAHGTGTAVGDPIEVAALSQAFRESTERTGFCAIGSVKPNIGHLDTAAGVASFVKVVLALEHGELPPSIGFERANPAIDFASSPFQVNAALRPWQPEGPRCAGVSSLGVGGTNAHAILAEAPPREPGGPARPIQLLPLSARTPGALDAASARLAAHLREHPELDLADVAWTLQVGRKAFEHRRNVACASLAEAAARLEQGERKHVATGKVVAPAVSTAFMFPGGGAQYPEMARGLYDSEPIFREHVDRGLALLRELDQDVRGTLFPEVGDGEAAARRFEAPSIQLPAIFVVEYALARLWESWGIRPAAMIGHSMGENTAACLAGVLSYEDTLRLVALRGRLFEQTKPGGMLSIALPADALGPYLSDELVLASANAPGLCVLSGPAEAIDALEARLSAEEVDHHRVRISLAAHSPLLEPILEEFGAYLRGLALSPPRIPFVSNRTGTWITDEQATSPDYWVQHLRHTVYFADGLGTLLETPGRVLLEVGPGRMLGSLARQHPAARPEQVVLSSLRHPEEDVEDALFLQGVLGRLWNAGVSPDWERLHHGERRLRVSLPGYPFERQRYWIEPGHARYESRPAEVPLEKLASLDDWFRRRTWRSEAPPEAPATAGEPHRWLVFLDAAGVGSELSARLAKAGHRVVTVREGDAFYRFADDAFALAPEAGRDGYDALVKELAAAGALPDRVVHLWLATADERVRPGSSFFHRNQERGFYSLLFLMQALSAEGQAAPLRVDVISTGLQSVSGEPLAHPDKATVLGPVQVIPHEFPQVRCRSVDVVLPGARLDGAATQRLLDDLLVELGEAATGELVAWRGGVRFTAGLEAPPAKAWEPGGTPLRERGVYLITGGLGGIGLALAGHLARQQQARLVLVARSELPAREAWDAWLEAHGERDRTSRRIRAVRALEAAGAEVLVAAGDVANIERMREIVALARERFGSLHGVFHTAGTMEDGVIPRKTPEAIERVFTPKVHGTLVLSELFEGSDLDFLVLFSSTSTVLGPPGQVDYTAANSFLDAFAESRRGRPGARVVAIDWGVWNEVGMARQLSEELRGDELEAAAEHARVDHPVLRERVAMADGRRVYAGDLSPGGCWWLDEHRLRDGRAVLPGTGYLELVRAAGADATGSPQLCLRGVELVSPLEVPDTGERRLEVVLEPDGEGFRFEVKSRDVHHDGAFQLHAQGRLERGDAPPPAPLRLAELDARCARERAEGEGLATDQEAFLAFGPRWRCLRQIGFGAGEALARLELPRELEADLGAQQLHPALLDVATGCALRLLPGYEPGRALHVPMAYDRLELHAPLSRSLYSHVRSRPGNAAHADLHRFDITVSDERGRVLVEVEGFAVRRLAPAQALAAAPAAAPAGPASVSAAERVFLESFAAGIRVDEGMAALDRILCHDTPAQVLVSSIDLDRLRRRHAEAGAREAEGGGPKFARPELRSRYEAPRDELEQALVAFWEELLGVDPIGIHDDFFELGGHSLIAMRLFARIKKAWNVEYPLSVLFDAPTVAGCAELLREELGQRPAGEATAPRRRRREHEFLVPMNDVGETGKAPFFLVSGMFGNVLNLRHLAAHLGDDQPVYAIQARGLYGDAEPHARFEDMARDYLAEVRSVQPEGPYFLGGFSGGGITAYEMAQQLRAAGERVAALVLLDTPAGRVPLPSPWERVLIQWQRLRRLGPGYLATWARNRARWELERLRGRFSPPPVREVTPAEFRSAQIEVAFRQALEHYVVRPWDGEVALFRPALDASHPLGRGRFANQRREIVDPHNFWDPFVARVHLEEVPGDHDAMVLEPYVRVLGAKLGACLESAHLREGGSGR